MLSVESVRVCLSRAAAMAMGVTHLVGGFVVGEVVVDDVVGEQVGFEDGDPVDAPGGVGEGLNEMRFGGALRVVFVDEALNVTLVGFEILAGHDDGLAGEAVTESALRGGASPALEGLGAGGVLRVGAIDLGADLLAV